MPSHSSQMYLYCDRKGLRISNRFQQKKTHSMDENIASAIYVNVINHFTHSQNGLSGCFKNVITEDTAALSYISISARYVDDNDLVETLLSGSALAPHTTAIKVRPAAAHISCHNARTTLTRKTGSGLYRKIIDNGSAEANHFDQRTVYAR